MCPTTVNKMKSICFTQHITRSNRSINSGIKVNVCQLGVLGEGNGSFESKVVHEGYLLNGSGPITFICMMNWRFYGEIHKNFLVDRDVVTETSTLSAVPRWYLQRFFESRCLKVT